MAAPLSDTKTWEHPSCPGVCVGPAVAAAGADVSGAANDLEQDRLLLRTFNEYCKANKQARALEVAQELHLVQCLEGESGSWAWVVAWGLVVPALSMLAQAGFCCSQTVGHGSSWMWWG